MFLLFFLLFTNTYAEAISCRGKIRFPDVYSFSDSQESIIKGSLNGVGLSRELWVTFFYAALYLEEPTSSSEEIIDSDQVKFVVLKSVVGLSRSLLEDEMDREFRRLCGHRCRQLSSAHEEFIKSSRSLIPGETATLIFEPNGFQLQTRQRSPFRFLPSREYGNLLLRSMLGEEARNHKLRDGMLGLREVCKK